jgi:hypothetical protein
MKRRVETEHGQRSQEERPSLDRGQLASACRAQEASGDDTRCNCKDCQATFVADVLLTAGGGVLRDASQTSGPAHPFASFITSLRPRSSVRHLVFGGHNLSRLPTMPDQNGSKSADSALIRARAVSTARTSRRTRTR